MHFSILALFAFIGLSQAFIPCSDPSGYVGGWIGRDHECAALVQTACTHTSTSSWRPGRHVKENCGSIPPYTAIATFLGPNGSFDAPGLRQHTAIFVRCEAAGIRVYDQWNGTPIAFRIIPWGGHSAQYNGHNYYTIA